jgi:hypothetical protein
MMERTKGEGRCRIEVGVWEMVVGGYDLCMLFGILILFGWLVFLVILLWMMYSDAFSILYSRLYIYI